MENFGEKMVFYLVLMLLISSRIGKGFLHSGITKISSSSSERDSLLRCPKQYIDVLAQCPEELSCNRKEDCSSVKVCCDNACGTRTCVHPWYPKDGDNSLCANTTCPGQGQQCKAIGTVPSCVCIDGCTSPNTNEDFVCGSDGMMYFTKCFMDMHACKSGISITATTCNSVPTPNTNIITPAENRVFSDDELMAPRVISVPDMKVVKEGDSVIFHCHVSGTPIPAIFWTVKRDRQLLTPGFSNEKMSISPISGNLEIVKLQKSDSGEYTCDAVNKAGSVTIKFILLVQGKTPRTMLQRLQKVDCGSFPSEQARRCSLGENQRRIKKLWVYNKNKKICTNSYFRDCREVTNKFKTWHACARACMDICKFPVKKGTCKGFVQRIFYDRYSGQCLPFAYSGCRGNANNFPDVYSCRARCPSPTTSPCDNHTVSTLPTTSPAPTCPMCYDTLVESVCRSEFIVVGVANHYSVRNDNTRKIGKAHQPLHISLTRITLDRSRNLNLLSLDLKNPEDARMEIDLNLDVDCPCPDVPKLLGTGSQVEAGHSRRIPAAGRSSETTVIVIGSTVNGVPTLNSKGYATKYTEKTYKQIIAALNYDNFCELLLRTSQQGR